jgi:hypothetical protein
MFGGALLADHMGMPEPRIKRYALVPQAAQDGVRRFALARVAAPSPAAERLERMEEIAARDRPEAQGRGDQAGNWSVPE